MKRLIILLLIVGCAVIPKNNVNTNIIDGRKQHILIDSYYNKGFGTTII